MTSILSALASAAVERVGLGIAGGLLVPLPSALCSTSFGQKRGYLAAYPDILVLTVLRPVVNNN